MAPTEPAVASLILPPDEALRQDPRCPNMECRRMDNSIGKIYNSTACLGRTVNTLAHLLLAINASLSSPDTTDTELVNVALRSVGSIAGHCGKVIGSLDQVSRCQVWIEQSPLSESCRAALLQLPLVPSQIFGPAVQEALDRRLVASEARCQLREQRASFKVPGYSPYSFHRATFPSRRQISGRGLPPNRSYRVQQSQPYGSPLRPYHCSRHATAASDNRPPQRTTNPLADSGNLLKLVTNRFSASQIHYWHSVMANHWILNTFSQGYSLQFRRHFNFISTFQFNVLPFGLSLAPVVFTKLVQAALAPLQQKGMCVLP